MLASKVWVEEDIAGVVAAAFTHWTSRADDPQLHDHLLTELLGRNPQVRAWLSLLVLPSQHLDQPQCLRQLLRPTCL